MFTSFLLNNRSDRKLTRNQSSHFDSCAAKILNVSTYTDRKSTCDCSFHPLVLVLSFGEEKKKKTFFFSVNSDSFMVSLCSLDEIVMPVVEVFFIFQEASCAKYGNEGFSFIF